MVINSTLATPLALRSAGYSDTAAAARGFGAATAAGVAKIEVAFAALVEKLSEQSLGARQANLAVPVALRAPDQDRIVRALGGVAEGGGSSARLSGHGALLAFVGQLAKNMGAMTLTQLVANSKLRSEQLQQRVAQGERLAQAQEAARQAEQAAGEFADTATEAAREALAAAEGARAEAERLQRESDAMDPADPNYAAKQSELGAARQHQAQAAQRSEQAAAQALSAASSYSRAAQAYQQQLREADQFNREDPVGLRRPDAEQMGSRSARMQALIGLLSQIMADASLDKLRNESELALQQLQASQKESLRLAEEQEKELERMREAEKKSGCFGKIFGWVSKALMLVASVAMIAVGTVGLLAGGSGAALIAAGVVGLALSIDQIQAEFTGFSAMGKVTEALGGAIAKALVGLGVDEELANQIGSIAATIVIMVAIIAAMVLTGNLAGAAGQVGKVAQLAKQALEVVQVLAQMANLGSVIAVGVGKIIVANIAIDIAELMASLEKLLFADEVIRELLAMVEAVAAQLNQTSLDLMKMMSDMTVEQTSTAKAVLAHVRTTA
ncbi:type III secretion system translocon subunit SctE [Stenotrophomonas indicatrix]|uniref:type III secretion system translocon subunit SctE n=1 Tax=Stenotrophomonas indicatrix TaxID=2045451 RepID=UPI00300BA65A